MICYGFFFSAQTNPLLICMQSKRSQSWGLSKIKKVPKGIQSEKSSKDTASYKNLVSAIRAQASPKRGTEPGLRKGKRLLLVCHTRCKCPMETTNNLLTSSSVSRS